MVRLLCHSLSLRQCPLKHLFGDHWAEIVGSRYDD